MTFPINGNFSHSFLSAGWKTNCSMILVGFPGEYPKKGLPEKGKPTVHPCRRSAPVECDTSKAVSTPHSARSVSSSQKNNDSEAKDSPSSSSSPNDISLTKNEESKERNLIDLTGESPEKVECSSNNSKGGLSPDIESDDDSLSNDKVGKRESDLPISNGHMVERVLKRCTNATIEECNKVLDAMEKLEIDNPLYVAACGVFCESQEHREQWMLLSKKSEELRIGWILMVSKKLGFL